MTIQELIKEAKKAGFTMVSDGVEMWDLDNFLEAMQDDEADYSFHFEGIVRRYDERGYEESSPLFRFFKGEGEL
ncbi:hypothetical protein NDK47_27585 (plasmid) [Brevibacillus ruminantium]|uniref:Uncharacterized protein n=1 Tax=Brevibacillus ruminantium TaxID=2950604 RepID=A0ABY4WN08_9BACL|nr:hypothetical protein [Brevibacillus ruminantium]USG68550.1 hypothetical protein NDK47_27585 [Brevibacillus ruminantium]